MDDLIRYAPLFIVLLVVFVGFQLNRIEKQNEGLFNLLRELLNKRS